MTAAKRRRRSPEEIEALCAAMYALIEQEHPMTVRQVFYRMLSAGLIAKTEQEYKNTVVRLLGIMRRERRLPFGWITDNNRWQRGNVSFTGLQEALDHTAKLYRRNVWNEMDVHVEIWIEKDALSGVVFEVTDPWTVPLMVTKGYPSLTYLHSAGEQIRDIGKPAFIYYFGDRDPSGVDIPRKVEAGLREFSDGAEIDFEVVAVTEEQIEQYSLPTRPTKQTDSRAKNFSGESVELDAIPPAELRSLVQSRIDRHVDQKTLRNLEVAERSERSMLQIFRTPEMQRLAAKRVGLN